MFRLARQMIDCWFFSRIFCNSILSTQSFNIRIACSMHHFSSCKWLFNEALDLSVERKTKILRVVFAQMWWSINFNPRGTKIKHSNGFPELNILFYLWSLFCRNSHCGSCMSWLVIAFIVQQLGKFRLMKFWRNRRRKSNWKFAIINWDFQADKGSVISATMHMVIRSFNKLNNASANQLKLLSGRYFYYKYLLKRPNSFFEYENYRIFTLLHTFIKLGGVLEGLIKGRLFLFRNK